MNDTEKIVAGVAGGIIVASLVIKAAQLAFQILPVLPIVDVNSGGQPIAVRS